MFIGGNNLDVVHNEKLGRYNMVGIIDILYIICIIVITCSKRKTC